MYHCLVHGLKQVIALNIEVVLYIINELKKFFGYLSVVGGKNHTFLVMNMEIKDNMTQADIVKQLEECIESFGDDVSASVTSPETKKKFRSEEIL